MKIRSQLATKLAAGVAILLLHVLFATCRRKFRPAVPDCNPYFSTGTTRYLYCSWHDMVVMMLFTGRPQKMAGLVSRHQDGSVLADSMKMLGITPVRGSTKRGGTQAMRELMTAAQDMHVTITPDGPRGPRRKLKDGIVFLASHSGRAIIPGSYACRRSWRIRGNWTDMLFPMPFTTIYAMGGMPIFVPPNLSRGELAQYTELVQRRMDELQETVDRWAAGDEEPRADERKAAA